MPVPQLAGLGVDVGQVRRHGRDVELGAALVGMGPDAAVGHHERRGVRHEPEVMGADPVARDLADPGVARPGVVDADDATGGGVVVLGREELAAVGGKDSVTIEVTPGRGLDPPQNGSVRRIQDRGEGAGPPREDDAVRLGRVKGDTVAPVRQRLLEA